MGIELKSPNAVPLILFTLLFYSGYKMTVEWLQCDSACRKDRIARLDFWVAHFIALAAIVIPIFQFLARIRIADWLTGHIPPQPEPPRIPVNMFLFMGVFWGVGTGMFALFAWKTYGLVKRSIVLLSLPVALCFRSPFIVLGRLVIVAGSLKTYLLVLAAIAFGNFLACHARTPRLADENRNSISENGAPIVRRRSRIEIHGSIFSATKGLGQMELAHSFLCGFECDFFPRLASHGIDASAGGAS